ncbi:hypothetical protein PTKIN_Ptkin04bG0225300 [Pterospermum kingtungense]
MEGSVSKRMIVSLVVVLMVVLAQGESANDHGRSTDEFDELCAAKCTARCALKIFPKRIARCYAACKLDCYKPTSEVVHNCTSNCVNSMINTYNPTDVADVDQKVESFVGSCYETCKNNNNN